MGSFWITFMFEWVVIPAFGIIFLAQRGRVTRAFSVFFFILGLPLTFSNQYMWLTNDAAGTTKEIVFKPYPTPIIQIAFVIHMALIVMAVEFLFDDLDRYGFEAGSKIGRKRKQPRI